MYCDAPYYDRYLIDDIFTNIIKNLIDIDKLRQNIKELLQLTIFTSLNSRKKYELLDLKTYFATQITKIKKYEALAIENPSNVDEEDYKNKVGSIKILMSQLAKQIKMVNNINLTAIKEDMINKKLNELLSRSVNYTLLAELHHLRLIIMPNYELVLARCDHELTGQDFRKKIKKIMAKEMIQNTLIH